MEHSTHRRARSIAVVIGAMLCSAGFVAAVGWGPLDPPAGPVGPTAKPLAEVEPRTAINAVNTPGDADSVFKITQPGSYYLTSNVAGVAAKSGIEVAVENVTIDLNGFEVVGVPGSLDGIAASLPRRTTVKNGTVRNWGAQGVDVFDFSLVSGVAARDNTGAGIVVGQSAVVTGCVAEGNGTYGFNANAGSVLNLCTARNNAQDGFFINSCTVTACTSRVNTGNGFNVQNVSFVTGCNASSNSGTGINVGTNGVYGPEVVDCSFSFNAGDGMSVASNSVIRGCTLNGNGTGAAVGAGIRVTGSDCRIEGNHCTDNERGIVATSTGNLFIRNTCASNTTNWDIAANNVVGPIVDRTAPASAAILGNSAPSSLGTTDPNANFTY